jgi:hypothetical protein
MLEKKVLKTDNGVNIKFTGDIKKNDVQNMIDSCGGGDCGCDCDPAMMEKIEDKLVSGKNGDVTISLVGKDIEVTEIQNALEGCNL